MKLNGILQNFVPKLQDLNMGPAAATFALIVSCAFVVFFFLGGVLKILFCFSNCSRFLVVLLKARRIETVLI